MKSPFSLLTISGDSMTPTLKPGQKVVTFNLIKPKVGDIVVAELKHQLVIKRVQKIDQKAAFLIGDNLEHSTDSRQLGEVSLKSILGKVIYQTTKGLV